MPSKYSTEMRCSADRRRRDRCSSIDAGTRRGENQRGLRPAKNRLQIPDSAMQTDKAETDPKQHGINAFMYARPRTHTDTGCDAGRQPQRRHACAVPACNSYRAHTHTHTPPPSSSSGWVSCTAHPPPPSPPSDHVLCAQAAQLVGEGIQSSCRPDRSMRPRKTPRRSRAARVSGYGTAVMQGQDCQR